MDHADDAQVINLFDRISREQKGRLDILVNNVYAGIDPLLSNASEGRKYWELNSDESPVSFWDAVNGVGLRNYYICSVLASRMMLECRNELNENVYTKVDSKPSEVQRPGIIFNISSAGSLHYLFAVPYGVGAHCFSNVTYFFKYYFNFLPFFKGKTALDRMTSDMATELRAKKKSISVISIWPGLVRTETFINRSKEVEKSIATDLDTQCEHTFLFSNFME